MTSVSLCKVVTEYRLQPTENKAIVDFLRIITCHKDNALIS